MDAFVVVLSINYALGWLFAAPGFLAVLVILYTLWRISRRVAVDDADKTAFQVAPGGRGSTPQTAALGASEAEVQAEADTATAT